MRVKTRNVDNIKLDGEVIDEVEDFAYLGSNITKDGGSDRDIVARIGKARTDFATEACREIKLRIFNTNVKSVLLYGSETWRATVGFAQIIRRGWVVNTLFSCISAFTCLQHHGERFHNIVTTGEN